MSPQRVAVTFLGRPQCRQRRASKPVAVQLVRRQFGSPRGHAAPRCWPSSASRGVGRSGRRSRLPLWRANSPRSPGRGAECARSVAAQDGSVQMNVALGGDLYARRQEVSSCSGASRRSSSATRASSSAIVDSNCALAPRRLSGREPPAIAPVSRMRCCCIPAPPQWPDRTWRPPVRR